MVKRKLQFLFKFYRLSLELPFLQLYQYLNRNVAN